MKEIDFHLQSTIHTDEYKEGNHENFGNYVEEITPLKNPQQVLASMAVKLSEVIAGTRPIDQVAILLTDPVYQGLRKRVALKALARSASGVKEIIKTSHAIRVHHETPAPGVIESVVVVGNESRSKAITIRLENFHDYWRATSIGFL
jgi:hypothetical protein